MSDASHPESRSAADIEADVERTRARVTRTIDALRESMSPGQLMDQMVDYARGSGGAEFVRNLGVSVRENPLPVLLIGAGIGWMVFSSQSRHTSREIVPATPRALPPPSPSTRMHTIHRASGPGVMDRVSETSATVRDSAGNVVSGVGQAASNVGSTISQAASSVGSTLSQAASSVRDAASSAASTVSDAASGVAGSVSGAIGSAGESVRSYRRDATHMAGQGYSSAGEYGGQLRQSWNRVAAEQPLLLGALGLAVGAALGALLPRTRTEDRLMGEARETVANQLGEVVQEQYEQAKDLVNERVADVKEKLSSSTPSASSIGDTVTDAARSLREKVTETARDLGETAKSGIEKNDATDKQNAGAKPDLASKPATAGVGTSSSMPGSSSSSTGGASSSTHGTSSSMPGSSSSLHGAGSSASTAKPDLGSKPATTGQPGGLGKPDIIVRHDDTNKPPRI